MVLRTVRIALKEDNATDVNKLLFAPGDHNDVKVKAGDKRNLSGLLICHPLLLSSPFEEPATSGTCNSFSPLIRSFLRIFQMGDLNTVEQHRVNKCITAQVTDLEQAILAQANDK